MTDCGVPPAEYYVELQKDMVRRHPKACRHVLERLIALEAFFDGENSVMVMTDNDAVRRNRLNLLGVLRNQASVLARFENIQA